MQIKTTSTYEWLAKIKNGKIKIPKEAFDILALKEGKLVYVQIAVMGEIVESNLKRMIIHPPIYECPYCGYKSTKLFPIEHYEGSSGYRTFRCPKCGKEMEE